MNGSEALPQHPQVATPSRRRYVAVTAVLLALAAGLAITVRAMRPKPPLPVLAPMPQFTLTDQTGARFSAVDLASRHAWVADFIFTHCTQTCPRLTASMKKLDAMLPDDVKKNVRFVSFSVDPENDTPDVLAAYAKKNGADPSRWTFVTGPSQPMQETVVLGFKMTDQRMERGANDYDVLHGNWFVVGDGQGIRGYYPTETDEDLKAIADDVTRLARGH